VVTRTMRNACVTSNGQAEFPASKMKNITGQNIDVLHLHRAADKTRRLGASRQSRQQAASRTSR